MRAAAMACTAGVHKVESEVPKHRDTSRRASSFFALHMLWKNLVELIGNTSERQLAWSSSWVPIATSRVQEPQPHAMTMNW